MKKMKKPLSGVLLLFVAPEVGAQPTRIVEWKIETRDAETHEVRTYMPPVESSGEAPLPDSNWKCTYSKVSAYENGGQGRNVLCVFGPAAILLSAACSRANAPKGLALENVTLGESKRRQRFIDLSIECRVLEP